MKKERRVVITGIGPISAIGFGKNALWSSILKQETGLINQKYKIDGVLWDSFWIHKITSFDIESFEIDKASLEEIMTSKKGSDDNDLFYLLAAIQLALKDSKLIYDKEFNTIGLFLTIEHPGFEPFCERIITEATKFINNNSKNNKEISNIRIFKHLFDRFVDQGYNLQSFMYLYLLTKAFGLHGYSLFTNNACASGLFTLESAVRQIRYGGSDACVVAGGDYASTLFKHLWFKKRRLYAEDGKIKPFSKSADGIVMGDGATAILIEELEHAQKRNAHIYAEYKGGGFFLEGWKIVYPNTASGFYQLTIEKALAASGMTARDIDIINPHGAGIKITDYYEAKAISSVFAKNVNQCPIVSAFKPFVGHNLGGSAILELVILLLCLETNTIPPTLNCQELDPRYNLNVITNFTKKPIKTALKLSCGFAGYNGAIIVNKFRA